MAAKDLAFLSEDIKRQRDIAQEALKEAKEIDEMLSSVTDSAVKVQLEKAKGKLLQVARDLATNASSTSSSAITVLDKFE